MLQVERHVQMTGETILTKGEQIGKTSSTAEMTSQYKITSKLICGIGEADERKPPLTASNETTHPQKKEEAADRESRSLQ